MQYVCNFIHDFFSFYVVNKSPCMCVYLQPDGAVDVMEKAVHFSFVIEDERRVLCASLQKMSRWRNVFH